jgi:hypothetical protein
MRMNNLAFKLIPIMTRFLIPVLIGATLGSLMGYFGQCSSGTCPLTSTWWRGAIYGGVMGLLLSMSSRH